MVRDCVAFWSLDAISPNLPSNLLINRECRCIAWLRMVVVLDYSLFRHDAVDVFSSAACGGSNEPHLNIMIEYSGVIVE